MAEVLFYHLETASLDAVLPDLLEKTLERGWRAVVRAGSRERVADLDGKLWTYRDESFLPHGMAGDGAVQPVWLTAEDDLPNAPQILFLVDGASCAPDVMNALQRCVMIFDGRDEAAVQDARKFWTASKDAGHEVAYWRQSAAGRWEKQM